ncbi:hypothetical protein CEXT_191711 [Caerostris extrusa]|uniref:Uncharacterized protein n=1 Tax=Caerostris extrusa TaxID=172846 RepID=A0AAV4NH85_CAEEX|nr:hypothetical protein CEXT_191711 [Caerostris extrusa]
MTGHFSNHYRIHPTPNGMNGIAFVVDHRFESFQKEEFLKGFYLVPPLLDRLLKEEPASKELPQKLNQQCRNNDSDRSNLLICVEKGQ